MVAPIGYDVRPNDPLLHRVALLSQAGDISLVVRL